jgi:hypothetical protein
MELALWLSKIFASILFAVTLCFVFGASMVGEIFFMKNLYDRPISCPQLFLLFQVKNAPIFIEP